MTLDAGIFLAAALRAADFGAAFFGFAVALDFAVAFLAGRSFAAVRADDLAAVARVALGLEGDFALTARFALFAAGLAFERDVDRLNPFVRLLLMCGSQKAAHLGEQPQKRGGAYHRQAPKSTSTSICGCFNVSELAQTPTHVPTKKNT